MALKEVYLIGNQQRLVVMNFIKDLENMGLHVNVIRPGYYEIDKLPRESVHVFLCIAGDVEFSVIKGLADKAEKRDMYLYITGTLGDMSTDEETFIRNLPGFHFPGLPLDMNKLLNAIEYNERKQKRILVIDDEPIMLRNIQALLEKDYDVSLVNSGAQALKFLDIHPIDLVLLDYEMPGLTAPEVLMKMRSSPVTEKIPIIFLTGKNDRESVMTVMRLKPEGYVLKNKSAEEIKNAVTTFFKKQVHINW